MYIQWNHRTWGTAYIGRYTGVAALQGFGYYIEVYVTKFNPDQRFWMLHIADGYCSGVAILKRGYTACDNMHKHQPDTVLELLCDFDDQWGLCTIPNMCYGEYEIYYTVW